MLFGSYIFILLSYQMMNDGKIILEDQQSNNYNRVSEINRNMLVEEGNGARLYILKRESASILVAV